MRETSHNIPGGILRAWAGPNTHKNSSKATTIAASPVYEVIPPLLRSLRDLLGASILSSFICSGRPQGESLHLTSRSKFIIICSCSRLSWRLSSSLLDRKPPVEWPLAFLYQTRPKTHHHFFSSDKFQPPWPEVWPFSLFMEEMCSPSYQLKDKV